MFKKLLLTSTLTLTTMLSGMAPAEAGTYSTEIFGDTVTATYVGEVSPGVHIVKDNDPVRGNFGRPTELIWQVSCSGDGSGTYRWMGDSNNPAWDEWEVLNTSGSQKDYLMYHTACVGQ